MLFLVLLTAPIWALFSLNTVADEIKPLYQFAIEIVEALLVYLMKLFAYVGTQCFIINIGTMERKKGWKREQGIN